MRTQGSSDVSVRVFKWKLLMIMEWWWQMITNDDDEILLRRFALVHTTDAYQIIFTKSNINHVWLICRYALIYWIEAIFFRDLNFCFLCSDEIIQNKNCIWFRCMPCWICTATFWHYNEIQRNCWNKRWSKMSVLNYGMF